MNTGGMPQIWTPAEVAEYLKVSETAVLEEFEKGRLPGFKVGSEWRCLESHIVAYVSKSGAVAKFEEAHSIEASEVQGTGAFSQIGPFDFRWPSSYVEHYEERYETIRQIKGRTFTFRIGVGNREAAGQLRRRVVVWLDDRPLVEFASGNDFEAKGLLASVIKLPNGRQVPRGQEVPPEYRSFNIATYDSIVQGPYASRNLAIVVDRNDLESMLRHAVIRAQFKGLI